MIGYRVHKVPKTFKSWSELNDYIKKEKIAPMEVFSTGFNKKKEYFLFIKIF